MKKILLILFLTISYTNYSQTPVEKFLKDWLGVRYMFGGETKTGIDCSALVQKFYKSIYDIDIPRVCWQMWDASTKIAKDSLKQGDILFFTSKLSPSGWHAGIYLGDNMFLHAANRKDNVKISCLDDEKYKQSYKGAGRF